MRRNILRRGGRYFTFTPCGEKGTGTPFARYKSCFDLLFTLEILQTPVSDFTMRLISLVLTLYISVLQVKSTSSGKEKAHAPSVASGSGLSGSAQYEPLEWDPVVNGIPDRHHGHWNEKNLRNKLKEKRVNELSGRTHRDLLDIHKHAYNVNENLQGRVKMFSAMHDRKKAQGASEEELNAVDKSIVAASKNLQHNIAQHDASHHLIQKHEAASKFA